MKFRHPSDGEIRRLLLADAIADIHARSRGTYGMLRIRAALEIEQGLIVNKKLVWKIMRELGLKGLPGPNTGVRNLKNVATCEDLVQRSFVATRPNELWLTDITEHPTREGKLYCCVVLDLYSRKVAGWAIDRRCEAVLVNDALAKAGASAPADRSRGPSFGPGVPTQTQGVVATLVCQAELRSSSKASDGVFQPRVLRGLVLSASATASRSSLECRDSWVPFGKY